MNEQFFRIQVFPTLLFELMFIHRRNLWPTRVRETIKKCLFSRIQVPNTEGEQETTINCERIDVSTDTSEANPYFYNNSPFVDMRKLNQLEKYPFPSEF